MKKSVNIKVKLVITSSIKCSPINLLNVTVFNFLIISFSISKPVSILKYNIIRYVK